MFKSLYYNLINLSTINKGAVAINLFPFLKKSIFLKNYSNYILFYIHIQNSLKLKTIQTSFWVWSLDNLIPSIKATVTLFILLEFFFTCLKSKLFFLKN